METVTKNLRDAVYVAVGLGVISYQRAETAAEQVRGKLSARRVELDKQVGESRERFTKLAKDLEDRFEPVLSQARTAAEQAQTNLRTYFNRAA